MVVAEVAGDSPPRLLLSAVPLMAAKRPRRDPTAHALHMREYRARLKAERQALINAVQAQQPDNDPKIFPANVTPPAPVENEHEVELAVRAELALMPGAAMLPGLAAVAVTLAKMLDQPGYASSGVAAQLRAALIEIRAASATAGKANRLSSLRTGVGSLKSGAA